MSELNITKLNPTLTLEYILDPKPDKDIALELDTYGLSDIKRNRDIKSATFVLNDQYLQVAGLLYQDIETLAQKLAENVVTIDELSEMVNNLNAERDRLKADLDAKEESDAEMEKRVKLIEKTVIDAEKHLEQLQEIRQADTARIKALHEERAKVKAELVDLHAERDTLQKDVEQLRTERDQLRSEKEQLQDARDAIQAEKDELATEVNEIRQDVQHIIKQFQARMLEAGVTLD